MNSHWSIEFFRSDSSLFILLNFFWILCNRFSIYSSTWSSSNHHRRIILSRTFISLRTTIESTSTRKLSSKMNWILLLRIVFSSTSSSIICSFNETTAIMRIMLYDRSFMTNSKIELKLTLINWISKFETIWRTSVTFTTFESIITSNSIASKSTSCWTSFMSNEIMSEHSIKSNELRIDSRSCLESSKNESMNSTTLLTSTTWRFIFMNRTLNQVATTGTLSSMIDTWDLLHSMISMTCIRRYLFNLFMRILSFVSMSIIIILNLSHQHQLSSLLRFAHLNLHQSVKHLEHFALKINTHVRSFYLTSFRISMHAHHRHFRFLFLHRHHMLRHRSWLESQRISSRNCRNWTKFIRSRRNSRIQTIILTSSWEFSSINVNVSNYHHMRTWKKRHSCLRNVHCFIFMIIIMRTSHSINFVSIWRNSLKNQNESVTI